MKFKSILLTAVTTLSLTATTMAQVPNYVPTNGLVGWWPFTGNANDESGNSNNGTVNGATLTTDRFGNTNTAYSFDGVNDFISIPDNNSLDFTTTYTISVWVQIPDYSTPQFPNQSGSTDAVRTILGKPRASGWTTGYSINSVYELYQGLSNNFTHSINDGTSQSILASSFPLPLNSWINIIAVKTPTNISLYRNGVLEQTINTTLTLTNSSEPLYIGKEFTNTAPIDWYRWFKGKADDIGIWNRALTQQEVTALYNASNCANNTAITPQTNSLATGNTATFAATTSDPNPSYVWQSDLGQGFQILNNFGNYSGVNTATLNIANVQLPNHTQPIRVISTSGNCIDTSSVAVINILDTCITNVTVYDTLLTTVTDTLVINTQITGINPPNNLNTLKVFPNPASTHITIDYGNFNAMSGYTLTIVNSISQTVFTTPINQQTSYIDLSTWTGNGIYFVQLIDPQNNTIENRKIVIQ
jgi:hypothetical protein